MVPPLPSSLDSDRLFSHFANQFAVMSVVDGLVVVGKFFGVN
jgi:hypothetical protein